MGKKYVNTYSRTDSHIVEKLLPLGMTNRTGNKQIPKYIVIHETSTGLRRRTANYDLQHYEDLLYKNAQEKQSTIAYHFLCSDDQVWQFIPEDEAVDHTGTYEGNHNSIGVERLVNENINFGKALHNQAKLVATLMKKWDIPLENVRPHRGIQWDYTPQRQDKTHCPSRMLAGQYGGWQRFIFEIKRCQKHEWYFEELFNEKEEVLFENNNTDLDINTNPTRFGGFDRDDDR